MSTPLPTLPIGPAASACCPAEVGLDAELPAVRIAEIGKALAEPVRVRILDVLRRSPVEVCQCELVPLFDMSQPALAKHLKVLVNAGVLGAERRGLWTYYFLLPDATQELIAWLS
jgi:ArsR family transcriptional regulator, arsenate/arsenite/antimonite-responsive transcriptional repressor